MIKWVFILNGYISKNQKMSDGYKGSRTSSCADGELDYDVSVTQNIFYHNGWKTFDLLHALHLRPI